MMLTCACSPCDRLAECSESLNRPEQTHSIHIANMGRHGQTQANEASIDHHRLLKASMGQHGRTIRTADPPCDPKRCGDLAPLSPALGPPGEEPLGLQVCGCAGVRVCECASVRVCECAGV